MPYDAERTARSHHHTHTNGTAHTPLSKPSADAPDRALGIHPQVLRRAMILSIKEG